MSADITVDDILGSRKSLRTRAAEARTRHLTDKRDRRYAEYLRLCEAAQRWMIDDLEVPAYDAAEVTFIQQEFNPDRAEAHWKLDGIAFKARFVEETVGTYKRDGDTVNIRDDVPKFEMSNRAFGSAAWKIVKTLADVGANL